MVCSKLEHNNVNRYLGSRLMENCTISCAVARRTERLQFLLHAAHRLQQDAEPQRQVQQWQVPGLHQPESTDRRRQLGRRVARPRRRIATPVADGCWFPATCQNTRWVFSYKLLSPFSSDFEIAFDSSNTLRYSQTCLGIRTRNRSQIRCINNERVNLVCTILYNNTLCI